MTRGYFGIGIVNIKSECNYGTLFRSAFSFGARFIFLTGKRFEKQSSDTTRSEKHLPLFRFQDIDDLLMHIPYNCQPVCVELKPYSRDIVDFCHPERAIYILGQEDGSLPDSLCERYPTVQIPGTFCLNVSVAGSIVMYDRISKARK